jgi:hypothetical protein
VDVVQRLRIIVAREVGEVEVGDADCGAVRSVVAVTACYDGGFIEALEDGVRYYRAERLPRILLDFTRWRGTAIESAHTGRTANSSQRSRTRSSRSLSMHRSFVSGQPALDIPEMDIQRSTLPQPDAQ